MTIKNRIEKLEKNAGVGQACQYMCVIDTTTDGDAPKGYKAQPIGDTGGDVFYFATREELDAFGARPDVDLLIITLEDDDNPISTINASKPYEQNVGIDIRKL